MADSKRELIATLGYGAQGVVCSCKGCDWGASVKPADEEAQKAFDSHRCEDFPVKKVG
jgi:ketol-acid reductoisomerase